jgi:hypothetical protein
MLGDPGWRHLELKPPRSAAPLLDVLGDEA